MTGYHGLNPPQAPERISNLCQPAIKSPEYTFCSASLQGWDGVDPCCDPHMSDPNFTLISVISFPDTLLYKPRPKQTI
jgi:hypothetical protein